MDQTRLDPETGSRYVDNLVYVWQRALSLLGFYYFFLCSIGGWQGQQ